jgi:predicted NBD/HSP70 family sugar kinase
MTKGKTPEEVITCDSISIGVDVGGTKIDAALVGADGHVLASAGRPTHKGDSAVVDDICALCKQLTDEFSATSSPTASPAAIGIGIPGTVDPATGTVRQALNLGIEEFGLGEHIRQRTLLPTRVENDVNVSALAADRLLNGGHGTTVFINFGTGLAAGLVRDGTIQSGAKGGIGEIGHIPVDPQGFLCPCGQRGCLETVTSGSGLARMWPTAKSQPIKDLFEHVENGDHTAIAVCDKLVSGMAQAIQLVAQTFDPDRIAVGGGMTSIGEPLRRRVDSELRCIEESCSFFASLAVRDRLTFLGDERHLGAIGASLAAQAAI